MKRLIIAILLFLFILPVQATTWVQLNSNQYVDKDNIKYYVNDYGNTDFNKKYLWMKEYNNGDNFKEIEELLKTISDKKIYYSVSKIIIDCNKSSLAIKSNTAYDKEGYIIHSYTYKDYEMNWNDIIPDSMGELWLEIVKHPKILKKIYKAKISEEI